MIIEPQKLGRYKGNYVTLGFSDGLSIYWGANSIALGFIDGVIHITPSPYASAAVNSYQFLLFSTENATGSSYLRQSVGSKTYNALTLEPFGTTTKAQMNTQDASFLGEKAVLTR